MDKVKNFNNELFKISSYVPTFIVKNKLIYKLIIKQPISDRKLKNKNKLIYLFNLIFPVMKILIIKIIVPKISGYKEAF